MEKKMLSLEVPTELREALRLRAFKEDVSISKLIRQLLEDALKEELAEARKEKADGSKK